MMLFIEFKILDLIDILVVAYLLFELYNLLRGTAAINILFGVVAVYLAWKVVSALEMALLSEIIGAFISVGFIALIVVFQPEIRRFLLRLGTPGIIRIYRRKRFLFWKFDVGKQDALNIDPVILACRKLSEMKTGALIVFAGRVGMDPYIETGEKTDAAVSEALLLSIFYKNSPLHDGAVIIQNNRITAARCVLPVSSDQRIPAHFGLRHRAAVGISEQTDSFSVIVSEETGHLAYAVNGAITARVQPTELKNAILHHFQ